MTLSKSIITLLVFSPVLAACATQPLQKELGPSSHYMCGETPLSIFSGGKDDTLQINVSGDTFPVLSSKTIYGLKYEDIAATPTLSFWDRGNTAILEIAGKTYPACQKVQHPNDMNIKNYRAIGNDPAWYLVIRNGKVIFSSMYREKIVTADLPEPSPTASGQSYAFKTGTQDMRISLASKACQDTLTSRLYPDQISVLFQGTELTGCGNRISGSQADTEFHSIAIATTQPDINPAPTPPSVVPTFTKKIWAARQIDGINVLTPAYLTLAMSDEGLFLVNGGCNQFSGTYKINDKVLTIDPKMVKTKNTCTTDLMKQEKIFVGILQASTLIDLRDDTLIISTPHRKTITFTQSDEADPLTIMP
ncbi:MAG: META domain-containing protein [Alphaproteobacteria bacterium]|nr:META domain-containing protein [Alphaproteobacteria bacterium]